MRRLHSKYGISEKVPLDSIHIEKQDIFNLVSQGLSLKKIAESLGISRSTAAKRIERFELTALYRERMIEKTIREKTALIERVRKDLQISPAITKKPHSLIELNPYIECYLQLLDRYEIPLRERQKAEILGISEVSIINLREYLNMPKPRLKKNN